MATTQPATWPRFAPDDFVDALASTWVAIARSVRGPLEAFRKPEGEAHTIPSLLVAMFLDVKLAGRHLSTHVDPVTLAATLAEVFGDRGPALTGRLLEKSARLEAALRRYVEGLLRAVERAGDRVGDDTEVLAALADPDAMGPVQQLWLRVTTWTAMTLVKGTEPAHAARLANAREAKRVLVRILAEHPPVLTEDAWDAIVAEEDIDVLRFWIALVGLRDPDLHTSQVRRALFENPALRRHAMALARDEAEMRKVSALVEEARAGGKRGPGDA